MSDWAALLGGIFYLLVGFFVAFRFFRNPLPAASLCSVIGAGAFGLIRIFFERTGNQSPEWWLWPILFLFPIGVVIFFASSFHKK